jgi:hypothetical protein
MTFQTVVRPSCRLIIATVSPTDQRWKVIEFHENECTRYLQESESFLFNILRTESFSSSDATSQDESPALPSPSVYVLPKQPARFYGRDNELKKIADSLADCNSVTLQGIAGVGKTSLALRFAYQSLFGL